MTTPCHIGSLWTVAALDGVVVILDGPIDVGHGVAEYVVAPLYTGDEPGFRWTEEDVSLSSEETGLGGSRYAAIWNVGPALETDLGLQVGLLPDEVTAIVRDVYWSVMDEAAVKHERLGKPIRSEKEAVAAYQQAELRRWHVLADRVARAESDSARVAHVVVTAEARVHDYLGVFSGVTVGGHVFVGESLNVMIRAPVGIEAGIEGMGGGGTINSMRGGAISVSQDLLFGSSVVVSSGTLNAGVAAHALLARNADYALAA